MTHSQLLVNQTDRFGGFSRRLPVKGNTQYWCYKTRMQSEYSIFIQISLSALTKVFEYIVPNSVCHLTISVSLDLRKKKINHGNAVFGVSYQNRLKTYYSKRLRLIFWSLTLNAPSITAHSRLYSIKSLNVDRRITFSVIRHYLETTGEGSINIKHIAEVFSVVIRKDRFSNRYSEIYTLQICHWRNSLMQ